MRSGMACPFIKFSVRPYTSMAWTRGSHRGEVRQLADVDLAAELPRHGVVFLLYLQRAWLVVVVNVLAFVVQ